MPRCECVTITTVAYAKGKRCRWCQRSRDPVADTPTRSTSILIRVTPEEREALKAAATRAGLGLGPWLRSLGMRAARTEDAQSPEPRKTAGGSE